MKPLDIRQCQGQTITQLYVQDWSREPERVEVVAPDETKLLNFDVGDWLVLDPYGDDSLPDVIRERVFGKPESAWTVAVNRRTGAIGIANYFLDTEEPPAPDMPDPDPSIPSIFISPWMHDFFADPVAYRLPEEFVARLDELRSKKRPFSIHIATGSLQSFVDREVGFGDFQDNVVFQFHFDGPEDWRKRTYLQVHQDSYRVCSEWRDCVPYEDESDDGTEVDPATGKPFEPGFWRCECGVLNTEGDFAPPYFCFDCGKQREET